MLQAVDDVAACGLQALVRHALDVVQSVEQQRQGYFALKVEIATARVKVGPLSAPPLTLLVLRHEGQEIRLNSL